MNHQIITLKLTIKLQQILSTCRIVYQFPNLTTKTLSAIMLLLVIPATVHAHRGIHAESNEIDACRLKVGYEWIHFSAYTPTLTGNVSYCEAIPDLGLTNLVFDYEGEKLRNVSIEFEVTKEPEGSRVFYHAPQKIKTGTVNGQVDFSQYGAGNYLAHITIVHESKKLDQHLPFTVGLGGGFQLGFIDTLLLVIAIIVMFVLWVRSYNKRKDKEAEMTQLNQE